MRDRLIELIKQAKKQTKNANCDIERNMIFADHLLANGVIVPPCKVGDSVYFKHADLNETCQAKVIEISNNYYTPSNPLWIILEYKSKLIGKQEIKITADDFMLACHYPNETETEKALKGGISNE